MINQLEQIKKQREAVRRGRNFKMSCRRFAVENFEEKTKRSNARVIHLLKGT